MFDFGQQQQQHTQLNTRCQWQHILYFRPAITERDNVSAHTHTEKISVAVKQQPTLKPPTAVVCSLAELMWARNTLN